MRVFALLRTGLALSTGIGAAAPSAWTHYSSDELGFEALFPVTPTVETENKPVQAAKTT